MDILTSNFFELFGVPVSFDVDLNKVQLRYRELQKTVHPDKFVNASAQEKRISMQQTSWINEALNTLKRPVDRASYLLRLKGVDINLENETTMDAEFLMEQMELREAVSEIKAKSVAKGSEMDGALEDLDEMCKRIKNETELLSVKFSEAYESEKLDEAKELIRKMQFLQKAGNEIERTAASIEDALY